MKITVFIGMIAFLFVIQSCNKEGIPPFTVHVHNVYDFDITLSGSADGCDYGNNKETNLLCTLRAGDSRPYETFGPGRPFMVSAYKIGTTEEVGSLYYTGKSGKHYKWVVGESASQVTEIN